jgi:predicted phage tail protein
MTVDPNLLFLSLITGGIGLVLFVYGKKQDRWPQLVAGIALMVYPYFVSTVGMTVAIAVGIVAALWIAVRQGW